MGTKNCPKINKNRSKTGPGSGPRAPKIDLKSVPGPTRDAQWRSGTSRSRLGASRERPRRAPGAPGESPRTARDAQRGARERSGEGRGDQNRRRVASASEKIEFFSLGSFAKRHWTDFSTIFVSFWFFCKVCEPSKVLRLLAKTEVRPFALRVAPIARSNLEKRRKSFQNRPRIVENLVSGTLGRPFRSTFAARSGSVELLGATRGASGRVGASRVDRAGRSGPLGRRARSVMPESSYGISNRDDKDNDNK